MKINLKYELDQMAADKISEELNSFSPDKLFHIEVYKLAESLNIEKKTALSVFIKGVYDGTFIIDWIYHCPTCGAVGHETLYVHEANSENFCKLCNKNFTNTLDDNIEVFFSIHPAVQVLDGSYKEDYTKKLELLACEGKYLTWKEYPYAIHGIELIQNNLYRELLGSDVLIQDQSLQIMKVAILFTDIKGSTHMYSQLGDAKAFALVREHFKILFDSIKKFDGVPVKTIGDAVMGVFVSSENAVNAALEAQKELISHYKGRPQDQIIEVKIGVHSGPALVVTLNNRLDYFGTTVNIAARTQDKALPNEVVISQELFNDKNIQASISAVTRAVQRQHTALKGLDGDFVLYHIPMRQLF